MKPAVFYTTLPYNQFRTRIYYSFSLFAFSHGNRSSLWTAWHIRNFSFVSAYDRGHRDWNILHVPLFLGLIRRSSSIEKAKPYAKKRLKIDKIKDGRLKGGTRSSKIIELLEKLILIVMCLLNVSTNASKARKTKVLCLKDTRSIENCRRTVERSKSSRICETFERTRHGREKP